jgi:hypothetical protein
MLKTLEKFNFGAQFINWIKTIYNSPTAVIKNNGWFSKKINLSRGIKQGCPLSALLFILSAELLSINIRSSPQYKGLGICNKQIKIIQYADDTVLFCKTKDELYMVLSIVNSFTAVAGPRLNLAKTEGIKLGKLKNEPDLMPDIKWCNVVKCLGIAVGTDKINCDTINWEDKLDKIQKLLDSWRTRELTLFGKALIVKSLAISKIVYSVINSTIPNQVADKVNKIVYNFIWNKKDRIKRKVMIAPTLHGGIKMIDIETFFTSLKASWIERLFEDGVQTWNCIGHYLLGMIDEYMLLETNFTNVAEFPPCKKLPLFYQQVIMSYNKCKYIRLPETIDCLKDQYIWGNKSLQIYSKKDRCLTSLHFPTWMKSGFLYVKDLPIMDGKIDVKHIMSKLNCNINIHVEVNKLQQSLTPYKNILMGYNQIAEGKKNTGFTYIPKYIVKTKERYNLLLEKKYENAKFKEVEHILGYHLEVSDLENICRTKIIDIKEKKISEFNFKMLHNILPCGALLSKWCDNRNKYCDKCNEVETISHLLWHCYFAKYTWRIVGNALDFVFSIEDLYKGSHINGDKNYIVSFIAYTLYKYRQISWNENVSRTERGLTELLKADLKQKINIYKILKYNTYSLMKVICFIE